MQNDYLELHRQNAINEAQVLKIRGGFFVYLKTMALNDPRIRQFYEVNPVNDGKSFLLAARKQYTNLPLTLRVRFDNVAYTTLENNNPDPTKSRMKNIETPAYDRESFRAQTIYTCFEKDKTFCGPCEFGEPPRTSPLFNNFFDFFEHFVKEHGVIDLFGCHFCGRCYTMKSELRAHDCDAYRSCLATHLLNKNYKGFMEQGIVFCVCVDCGKHKHFKIPESQSVQSFFEFSRFYIKHSPKNLALMVVWSESTFLQNPTLVIKTSLRCDLKTQCTECGVDSFGTVAERNAHFAFAHAMQMTKKCPYHECNEEYIDEFRLKEHVLRCHLKNGLLAHFLTHDAAVRRDDKFLNCGKVSGKNEIDSGSFVVGGIDSNSKTEFMPLPPTKVTPRNKSLLPFDKEVCKELQIDANAMNIDFQLADKNLKISTTAFKRNSRGVRVKNMQILEKFEISNLSISKDLTDECTIEINFGCEKGGIEGIFLKERLGYCEQCEKVLNGPDAIKNHLCSEDEVTILAIRGYRTHSTVRCPKCEGINCCSVDGLFYHLFEKHEILASYEEDETSNDAIERLTRETIRNNRLSRLDSTKHYEEISDDEFENTKENNEVEIGVINELSAEIIRPDEEVTKTSARTSDDSEVMPTLGPESLATCVNDDAMDTGEGEPIKPTVVDEDVSIRAGPSNAGEELRNTENENPVITLDDDDDEPINNHPLLDAPLDSVQCLTPAADSQASSQETFTSRFVRNEVDDGRNDPAVMNSTVADEDDDILIVEDVYLQKQQLESAHRDSKPVFVREPEVSAIEEGDDECMAFAVVKTSNQVEPTKSKRNPTHGCTKCQKKFYTETSLQMHINKDHSSDFNDLYETDYGVPREGCFHVCLHCVSAFDDAEKFKIHQSKHTTLHDCRYCSCVFLSEVNQKEHMLKHQQRLLTFSCGQCFESFLEESHLMYHLALSHGIPVVYYCKKCFIGTCVYDPEFCQHVTTVCNRSRPPNFTVDQLMGCVPASLLAFQPKDEQTHRKKLEECPSSFVAVSTCSHRSLCRHSDQLINCQEVENGSTCNVIINRLAFEGLYKARNGFDAQVPCKPVDQNKAKSIVDYYFDCVKSKMAAEQNQNQQKQDTVQQVQQQAPPQQVSINQQIHNFQQSIEAQRALQLQHQRMMSQQQQQQAAQIPQIISPLQAQNQMHFIQQQRQLQQQIANQQPVIFHQQQQQQMARQFSPHQMRLTPLQMMQRASLQPNFAQPRSSMQQNHVETFPMSYDLAINVFRIDPSLLCFLCCNEQSETLVQLQLSDVTILIANILKFYSVQYGPQAGQILQLYLTKRSHAIGEGNGRNRPVSMCRNHFVDQNNTAANADLAFLPQNYLVPIESVESHPVIYRIHFYVDGDTQRQQQRTRNIAIRPRQLYVSCSLCEFLTTPTRCEIFSMLRLNNSPSKLWVRILTKQLKSKIPNLQKHAAENILKAGNFLCVKHFTPAAFGINAFQLVLLEDKEERNFPLLEPVANIFTADFIERFHYFRRILQAGQSSVHQIQRLLDDLRNKSLCKYEQCKRGHLLTSQDVVIHSLHAKEEHFLCFICNETISIEGNNMKWSVMTHLVKAHEASDVSVGCSIWCTFRCGMQFKSQFDYRMHMHERHHSIHNSCCGLGFSTPEVCKAHDEMHKNTRTLECCIICDYVGPQTFTFENKIVRHEWLHSVDFRWNCRICLDQFANNNALTIHYKSVHNKNVDVRNFFKFNIPSIHPKLMPPFASKLIISMNPSNMQ